MHSNYNLLTLSDSRLLNSNGQTIYYLSLIHIWTSTVSRTQGTGLGMAITKNIVDMMGGTIEAVSYTHLMSKCSVPPTPIIMKLRNLKVSSAPLKVPDR